MNEIVSASSVKFQADIEPVREVTLMGLADPAYWSQRLEPEQLTPAVLNNRAQLLIIAAEMKFKGIRFRELSISVLARSNQGDGAFLLHAFNTVRFFAFVERNFFSAPYFHGDVQVSVQPPVLARGAIADGGAFAIEMAHEREPARVETAGWEGPVFLPGATSAGRKYFIAKIWGRTRFFPFASSDTILIKPSPRAPVLRSLLDSGFQATEWAIRDKARHAKSKTTTLRSKT